MRHPQTYPPITRYLWKEAIMIIPGKNPNTPASPIEAKTQDPFAHLREQDKDNKGSVPSLIPFEASGTVDLDKVDEVNKFGNHSARFKGTNNETGEPMEMWMNTKKDLVIYGNTLPDPIDPKQVTGKVWHAIVYGTVYTNPETNRKKFYFDCLVLDIEGGPLQQSIKPRDFSKNPLLEQ